MNSSEEIFNNQRYKKIIDNLSDEGLKIILIDDIKSLEAAKDGIKKVEPERIDDVRYLQDVANGMQKLARVILATRQKK